MRSPLPPPPNIRQGRHQRSSSDVDLQQRQGADAESEPILERLPSDEEMVEQLPGMSHQVGTPGNLEPVDPVNWGAASPLSDDNATWDLILAPLVLRAGRSCC